MGNKIGQMTFSVTYSYGIKNIPFVLKYDWKKNQF